MIPMIPSNHCCWKGGPLTFTTVCKVSILLPGTFLGFTGYEVHEWYTIRITTVIDGGLGDCVSTQAVGPKQKTESSLYIAVCESACTGKCLYVCI